MNNDVLIPITEFYDDEPLLTVEKLAATSHPQLLALKKQLNALKIKTAIITWLNKESESVADVLKDAEFIHWVYGRSSGRIPVYIYRGFLLVFAAIGSPMAAGIIEELGYFGIENFIAYGTAGCIDNGLDAETILVVDRAIRDEGTSNHYLSPSVYVETNAEITAAIERVFAKTQIKYQRGTVWTTDALYRETGRRVAKRLSQGAVAVDMECAGFAAAAKKKGLKFGQFLFFSDKICANKDWEWMHSDHRCGDMKVELLPLALEIGEWLKGVYFR